MVESFRAYIISLLTGGIGDLTRTLDDTPDLFPFLTSDLGGRRYWSNSRTAREMDLGARLKARIESDLIQLTTSIPSLDRTEVTRYLEIWTIPFATCLITDSRVRSSS